MHVGPLVSRPLFAIPVGVLVAFAEPVTAVIST
jgi:hypothetical protein